MDVGAERDMGSMERQRASMADLAPGVGRASRAKSIEGSGVDVKRWRRSADWAI